MLRIDPVRIRSQNELLSLEIADSFKRSSEWKEVVVGLPTTNNSNYSSTVFFQATRNERTDRKVDNLQVGSLSQRKRDLCVRTQIRTPYHTVAGVDRFITKTWPFRFPLPSDDKDPPAALLRVTNRTLDRRRWWLQFNRILAATTVIAAFLPTRTATTTIITVKETTQTTIRPFLLPLRLP